MIPQSVYTAAREAGRARIAVQDLTNIPVPYIPQENETWCWAAAMRMVVLAHQTNAPQQCELANMAFDRTDCCPANPACFRGFGELCTVFEQMQFNCRENDIPLTFTEVVNQIEQGNPFIYNLDFTEAEHAGVVSGCGVSEGVELVYFLDPDAEFFRQWGRTPYGWIKYTDLLNGYGFGNWAGTWYDIEQP